MNALLLEKHLIAFDEWPKAPQEAQELAVKETALGVPTGISLHLGRYYVIQSSGQGPYVIWEQP